MLGGKEMTTEDQKLTNGSVKPAYHIAGGKLLVTTKWATNNACSRKADGKRPRLIRNLGIADLDL